MDSVTGVIEYLWVQRNFLVGFKVRGSSGNEDVHAGFLLFSVRGFVGRRGLTEKPLAVFRCEVSHSLV